MASFHLVNIWTDAEVGAGGVNPMVASLLWLPEERNSGSSGPAFIFVHCWGGYPYDRQAQMLGPALADRGFVFLSVCMRRRGMEGQMSAVPDNDLRDLKLAVDYLQTNGATQIFLIGEEIGSLSTLRYQAKTQDQRVTGVALIDPVDDADALLRRLVGEETYAATVHRAGVAARQGAGMDARIDLLPESGLKITQRAAPFLSWWGPMADTKLTRSLEDTRSPMLILADREEELPQSLRGEPRPGQAWKQCFIQRDEYAEKLIDWAGEHGAKPMQAPPLEHIRVKSAGKELFGLLWTPADRKPVKTVILLMHGLTGSPLSPLFGKMAPVLAQTGTAVLAIESHRSGFWGHETALIDDDNDAIDSWMGFLLERGFERIVLAGASMGSLSVGRYQSMRQHPNVAALAHLMPTADCPEWFRAACGTGDYENAVAAASEAVEQGRGEEVLIDIDVRQPPPSLFPSYFRWTQRAASWLSWWGPDADSRNTRHIANTKVPILLLAGTDDSYNDAARFAELKAAAIEAPSVDEIWYEDVDHGLAGVETQVAQDLIDWLQKLGLLNGGTH